MYTFYLLFVNLCACGATKIVVSDNLSHIFKLQQYMSLSGTINRSILLEKLAFYEVAGVANEWFASYRSNRVNSPLL